MEKFVRGRLIVCFRSTLRGFISGKFHYTGGAKKPRRVQPNQERALSSLLQNHHTTTDDLEIGDSLVWRYMDLAKFLDLVQTSELHFTRLDKLPDPYEHELQKAANQRNPGNRETMYINCWALMADESEVMWKIYGAENGVAIQSSRRRFESVLQGPTVLENIGASSVSYGRIRYRDNKEIDDLSSPTGDSPTNVVPSFSKRLSFIDEQEIRMEIGLRGEHLACPHLRIRVNLDDLIERIYVSPTAPTWIADVVRRVVKQYRLEKEVIHSDLLSVTLA